MPHPSPLHLPWIDPRKPAPEPRHVLCSRWTAWRPILLSLLCGALALSTASCTGAQGATSPSASAPPPTAATAAATIAPSQASTSRTSAAPSAPTQGAIRLAKGELPTNCATVTLPARLAALEVTGTAQQTFHAADRANPMPTSDADAEKEGRVWPGLFCLYPGKGEAQEAMVQVMPDTSPFFATRQTTSCKPTFGKGEKVSLGTVQGWYCPTTNESAIEWVSYVRDGRIVVVSRLSKPAAVGPYKAALLAYATELAAQL